MLLRDQYPDGSVAATAKSVAALSPTDKQSLDHSVLNLLAHHASRMRTISHLPVFVNVCLHTLVEHQETMITAMRRLLRAWPGGLALELHEESYRQIPANTVSVLDKVRTTGAMVLLDDLDRRHPPVHLQKLADHLDGVKVDIRLPMRGEVWSWIHDQKFAWCIAECGMGDPPFTHHQSFMAGKPTPVIPLESHDIAP